MRVATESEISDLQYSDKYVDYIMAHSNGDRIICNGDMLTVAMEDGYLFDDFLDSIGLYAF